MNKFNCHVIQNTLRLLSKDNMFNGGWKIIAVRCENYARKGNSLRGQNVACIDCLVGGASSCHSALSFQMRSVIPGSFVAVSSCTCSLQ
jgi:hypothetical protein